MIMPFREPWYVVPSAIGIAIPQFWTSTSGQYWLYALSGVFAIIVAVQGGPPVMPRRWRLRITRWFTLRARAPGAGPLAGGGEPVLRTGRASASAGTREMASAAGLELSNLTIRFGGLVAVDDLSMSVRSGQITGLIGPNGAGKTTTFNACSGLNRPAGGVVTLQGEDVSRLSPGARARRGLGRTFQRVELADALTVAENVALGREASQAGSSPLQQLIASRNQHRLAQQATNEALELCGLTELADARLDELPTGQRRLVEVARCLAGPFDVLLLDEPSAGLDRAETERLGEILREVVSSREIAVLLVEHDVGLVMSLCSYIYVLDFGKLVFDGAPEDVKASPVVQAAYLGAPASDPVAVESAVAVADRREAPPQR
jgi:ABC-type branched-subunit amino acid transport system ATPase component